MTLGRQRLARAAATGVLFVLAGGCSAGGTSEEAGGGTRAMGNPAADHEAGRLGARPRASAQGVPARGMRRLGGEAASGHLYVPASYKRSRPAPLVLGLHGAGGDGTGAISRLVPHADETGAILLAPKSRGRTWDVILDGFGPDVELIDRLLARVFRRYAIDADRVGVQGFSDGASYALSIGLINGDLFRHVVAFSPGFMEADDPHGSPVFFITHGTEDPILPIDQTSREIVPTLREEGYEVTYREFEGRHEVPNQLVPEAFAWLSQDGQ